MAKYCTSCGAPLEGAAKFCPGCGTQTVAVGTQTVPAGAKAPESPQPVQQAPLYSPPSVPAPAAPKKKSKAPLIVGGAIALVALIAVIAFSGRGSGNGPAPYSPDYSSGGVSTTSGNPGQSAQPTEPPTQQPSGNIDKSKFTGEWDSDTSFFEKLSLTQNGNSVTGSFDSLGDKATLSGTVSGKILTATATYKNGESGQLRLTLSDDGEELQIESWDDLFERWSVSGYAYRTISKTPYVPVTPPPGAKVDPNLTGQWQYNGVYSDMGNVYNSKTNYYFRADGTFEIERIAFSHYRITGKYSVCEGKMYLTELNRYAKWINSNNFADDNEGFTHRSAIMEYELGRDGDGPYLIIGIIGSTDIGYFELSRGDEFRKK